MRRQSRHTSPDSSPSALLPPPFCRWGDHLVRALVSPVQAQLPGYGRDRVGVGRAAESVVKRKTVGKRMRVKLEELEQELRQRMHDPAAHTGKWLRSVAGLLQLPRGTGQHG
ncbi:MAG: hypothetical protein WB676_16720 [Bryobacteraceae bacterium]